MTPGSIDGLIQTMDIIITELEKEGLIDNNFRMVAQLKDVNDPYFFANLVRSIMTETQNALMEIARLLDEFSINYEAMDQIAIKLKGSASCIGTVGISRACANLRYAVEVRSHIGCIQAKNDIQYEFGRVHARMDAINQIEQQILSQRGIHVVK